MSILIKGMEMPETCMKCVMQIGGWCYVSPPEIDERVAPTVDEAVEQGKPEWCPLVEVPTPHGRLIDANETYNKAAECVLECDDEQQRAWFIHGIGFIAYAPTIIEAEE